MGYLVYQKHYRVPWSYDLTTFQILGQKLSKFIVDVLVQTMVPKGQFEMNWPLVQGHLKKVLLLELTKTGGWGGLGNDLFGPWFRQPWDKYVTVEKSMRRKKHDILRVKTLWLLLSTTSMKKKSSNWSNLLKFISETLLVQMDHQGRNRR